MTRSPNPVARPVQRRPVLIGLTAAIALPAVAGSVAGCSDEAPDPLIALVNQAYSDAAVIDAAARAWQTPPTGLPEPQAGPISAELLTAVSGARRTHAEQMSKELGDDAPPAPPSGQSTPAQDPKAALAAVLNALDAARSNAAALVPGLSRHQAALVGSVAACCAAYRSVLL